MSKIVTISIADKYLSEWDVFKNRTAAGFGTSNALMALVRLDNERIRNRLSIDAE